MSKKGATPAAGRAALGAASPAGFPYHQQTTAQKSIIYNRKANQLH